METMVMRVIPKGNSCVTTMDKYFVYAQTISGARFYSEKLYATELSNRFDEYCGMVKYFDGGIVVACAYSGDDYETLYDKVIL